jgi:hypothetical protein
LEAAFDDDEGCQDLLESEFPLMVGEELHDNIAVMMNWKIESARPLKRFRKGVVNSALFVLPQPNVLNIHDEFQRLTKTSVQCILEMHSKRKQRKYREDHQTSVQGSLNQKGESTPCCWHR